MSDVVGVPPPPLPSSSMIIPNSDVVNSSIEPMPVMFSQQPEVLLGSDVIMPSNYGVVSEKTPGLDIENVISPQSIGANLVTSIMNLPIRKKLTVKKKSSPLSKVRVTEKKRTITDLSTSTESTSSSSEKRIVLQEHQLNVSKALASFFDNQKGMLVYHYMGTGKTLTGLSFLKNFENPAVIICPSELITVWQNEIANNPEFQQIPHQIITYEDLIKKINSTSDINILDNKIVIMDECQNILKYFYKQNSKDPYNPESENIARINQIYKYILKSFKILLLSGTPIYRNDTDIRYLINIAAGNPVLPMDEKDFVAKYFKPKRVKKAAFSLMNASYYFIQLFLANKISNFMNDTMQNIVVYALESSGLVPPHIINAAGTLTWFIAAIRNGQLVNNMITNTWVYLREKNYRYINQDAIAAANIGKYISYFKFSEESSFLPKVTHETRTIYYSPYQFSEYLEFSNSQMSDEKIKKYFSLASTTTTNNKKSLTDEDPDVTAKADEYLANVFNFESYLDRGRIFGNVYEIESSRGGIPNHPKFEEIIAEIRKIKNQDGYRRCAVVYSNFNKYGLDLFENYITLADKKGEFIVGRLDPRKPVDEVQATITFFNSGRYDILLLDPVYTKGITLKGVRQFHIMEPLTDIPEKEQLVGRVVRFQSHTHYNPEHRNVIVYQWLASAEQFNFLIQRRFVSILNTMKNVPDIIGNFRTYFTKFLRLDGETITKFVNTLLEILAGGSSKTTSPDEYVFMMEKVVRMALDDFAKTFKDIGSEKLMEANLALKLENHKCCVWNQSSCKVCNKTSCHILPDCIDYHRKKNKSTEIPTIDRTLIKVGGGSSHRKKYYFRKLTKRPQQRRRQQKRYY